MANGVLSATALTFNTSGFTPQVVLASTVDGLQVSGPDVGGSTRIKIRNVAEPFDDSDAATRYYVNQSRFSVSWHEPVRAGSDVDVLLTAPGTVGGVVVVDGDRVLLYGQTNSDDNGLYLTTNGVLGRAADMPSGAPLTAGAAVLVTDGTAQNLGFVLDSSTGVVGSAPVTWVQFTGLGTVTAGRNLTKTGNTIDLDQVIAVTGSVTGESFVATSDLRKKHDLRAVAGAEEAIRTLQPTVFKWRSDSTGRDVVGLVAQDVAKVLPSAVHEDADGFLSVDYNQVFCLLMADHKRLSDEVDELRASKRARS